MFLGVRARVSRCSPQFDVPHVQSAAHLESEWLRAPLVRSNWLPELSAPAFPPKVALDLTSEAVLKSQSGTQRATGALTWAWRAAIEREGPRECDSYEHMYVFRLFSIYGTSGNREMPCICPLTADPPRWPTTARPAYVVAFVRRTTIRYPIPIPVPDPDPLPLPDPDPDPRRTSSPPPCFVSSRGWTGRSVVEADDAARSFFPFGGVFWLSVGACRRRTTASGDCQVGLLDGARPLVA